MEGILLQGTIYLTAADSEGMMVSYIQSNFKLSCCFRLDIRISFQTN